uniref:Uncharacterized protein n=1 Tax=Picea glauca TaxID=3330 RepID=A0A124GNB1_PICGL|nr:hypothetical protein ABT39_MTgene5245 [Picea glauca]
MGLLLHEQHNHRKNPLYVLELHQLLGQQLDINP